MNYSGPARSSDIPDKPQKIGGGAQLILMFGIVIVLPMTLIVIYSVVGLIIAFSGVHPETREEIELAAITRYIREVESAERAGVDGASRA
jgi:hypothetical protein